MFGKRPGRAGIVGGRTVIQRAIAVLRRYGQDAHIYLPGVGMLNGLTAANYLDSAGTTAGTVDQPVGLVLDAASTRTDYSLGGSLFPVLEGGAAVTCTVVGAIVTMTNAASGDGVRNNNFYNSVLDPWAAVEFIASGTGSITVFAGGTPKTITLTSTPTLYEAHTVPNASAFLIFRSGAANTSASITITAAYAIRGIHASQPTTANKPVLRLTNSKYNWLFDATDLLTATYPAGNESVTVIDALGTGQVTTTGVNVVGAYSMGPSVTLYGRMIVKGTLSASELATLQSYANRLAGV